MTNTEESIERFNMFRVGWSRRSAVMLDAIGCPVWLVKRRCPFTPGFGRLIIELGAALNLWHDEDWYEED